MKLIIGLGNPGAKYEPTRHNAGFWVLDALARTLGVRIDRRKHHGLLAETVTDGEKVVLLKPQTYMNLSGQSVREAVDWYGCTMDDLMIVYDDMDLPAGAVRLRVKGSAGGHNGMKSIIAHLGGSDFPRVRIGVGRPETGVAVIDHVLTPFGKDEIATVEASIDKAKDAILFACRDGFNLAMNRFNGD